MIPVSDYFLHSNLSIVTVLRCLVGSMCGLGMRHTIWPFAKPYQLAYRPLIGMRPYLQAFVPAHRAALVYFVVVVSA